MALKKPLVIGTDGTLEQLQSGDTLDSPSSGYDAATVTNGEAGSITIGQVTYISAANTVLKAQADAIGTSRVFGLVLTATIGAGASGQVVTNGLLSGLSSLTPGAVYFLDGATAGAMTATRPTSGVVVELGKALSATEFQVSIRRPIKL